MMSQPMLNEKHSQACGIHEAGLRGEYLAEGEEGCDVEIWGEGGEVIGGRGRGGGVSVHGNVVKGVVVERAVERGKGGGH